MQGVVLAGFSSVADIGFGLRFSRRRAMQRAPAAPKNDSLGDGTGVSLRSSGTLNVMTASDQITENLLADAMITPPFTPFVKQHRPLPRSLARYGQLLVKSIVEAKSIAALDTYEAELRSSIDRIRPVPPKLGPGGPGGRDESWRFGPPGADGSEPGITRFWFRRELIGAAGLLSAWPTTDDALEPIDRDAEHPYIVGEDPVWTIAAVAGHSAPYALYTPFDLASAELDLVERGELSLQGVYDAREAAMLPIFNAIVAETDAYFDRTLPAQLVDAIQSRRARLRSFDAVAGAISFPETWKLPAPAMESESAPQVEGDGDPKPAHVVFRDRLAPASFEDVQRSIRVWANAVERYPTAFNALEEDRISDLLAATLNASLPGADREVFSRRGKTDIQVRANAIEDGSSEAVIFITETKFATSESVVINALDPQLFSYLNAADTAAVLLLLFRQKNRNEAYTKYLPLLRQVEGFQGESDSVVTGWKINRYERDGRELRLLVATVHIPPV